jgi:diguanylate cyclase (GGDEF)-like protein
VQSPTIQNNEDKRLASLHALNILDTPFEERFDRITRFASNLFDVPIALVSLIDQDRQWFKSSMGLDVRETSRAISFCGHTIHSKKIMMVRDAKNDQRFADNPLVTGPPHIRFYAGCPISAESGYAIGSLCLIDRRPREFNDDDLDVFRDLTLMVEREIIKPELDVLDTQTHISNRKGFSILAEKGLDLCARRDITASLVFIELDKFNDADDKRGRAETKRKMAYFAEYLNTQLEQSGLVARVGKHQFVALLIDICAANAELAMIKFKTEIDALSKRELWLHPLQYSYGTAEFDAEKHSTVEKFLTDADIVMYDRKKKKRYAERQEERID